MRDEKEAGKDGCGKKVAGVTAQTRHRKKNGAPPVDGNTIWQFYGDRWIPYAEVLTDRKKGGKGKKPVEEIPRGDGAPRLITNGWDHLDPVIEIEKRMPLKNGVMVRIRWLTLWLKDRARWDGASQRLLHRLETGNEVAGCRIIVTIDMTQDRVTLRGCDPESIGLLSEACRTLGFPYAVT